MAVDPVLPILDAGRFGPPPPAADGAAAWWTWPADRPPPAAAPGLHFATVPLDRFDGWLRAQIDWLPTADTNANAADAAGAVFPRLVLPTGEPAHRFLKGLDHACIAAWLAAVEMRAAATGRTPARGLILVAAADFTRAALDLRHLVARHCPRTGRQAGRWRLALVLDDFGVDRQGHWQAGMRLGVNYPVYLLARALPGVFETESASASAQPPAALADSTRARAEEIFHGAVGELGTERILFGSGATGVESAAAVAARQAELAAWFRAPRPWLDAASVDLLFGANARRLAAPTPAPEPGGGVSEPLPVMLSPEGDPAR